MRIAPRNFSLYEKRNKARKCARVTFFPNKWNAERPFYLSPAPLFSSSSHRYDISTGIFTVFKIVYYVHMINKLRRTEKSEKISVKLSKTITRKRNPQVLCFMHYNILTSYFFNYPI